MMTGSKHHLNIFCQSGMLKNPINKYYLKDGLLESGATGGDVWNPLKSGRVNFELMLFQRYRSFSNEESDQRGKTTGIKYAIEYDNRDFKLNPTKGSLQNISLARDYGWSNSTDEWNAVQLDLRKYISFGPSEYFRE